MYIPNTIRAAIVDDTQPQNGGIKKSTEVGIGVGLLCFLSLILGFYIVSKWRGRPRPPPTHADEQIARTYERWEENITGKANSIPLEQHAADHYLPSYTPRSVSALSGATVVEHQSPEYIHLSPPSPAYSSHGQAHSLDAERSGVL